jgi:hypothetical protein
MARKALIVTGLAVVAITGILISLHITEASPPQNEKPGRPQPPVTPSHLSEPPPPLSADDPTEPLNKPLLIIGGCILTATILAITALLLIKKRRKPAPEIKTSPSKPSRPCLTSTESEGDSIHFNLLREGVTLGRASDNDLVIPDSEPGNDTVSRYHARIYYQDNQWIIEDLDSTNGVYVNGKRTGVNTLHNGWQIGLGDLDLTFLAGTEDIQ